MNTFIFIHILPRRHSLCQAFIHPDCGGRKTMIGQSCFPHSLPITLSIRRKRLSQSAVQSDTGFEGLMFCLAEWA